MAIYRSNSIGRTWSYLWISNRWYRIPTPHFNHIRFTTVNFRIFKEIVCQRCVPKSNQSKSNHSPNGIWCNLLRTLSAYIGIVWTKSCDTLRGSLIEFASSDFISIRRKICNFRLISFVCVCGSRALETDKSDMSLKSCVVIWNSMPNGKLSDAQRICRGLLGSNTLPAAASLPHQIPRMITI